MIGNSEKSVNNIVITGALGFIGSCVAAHLERTGLYNLVLVDDFSKAYKNQNLTALDNTQRIDRSEFLHLIGNRDYGKIDCIIHMGARTDTTEFNKEIFDELNLNYSKALWQFCSVEKIPLIYASSAATYGAGENGYVDDHNITSQLKPLNPYGESKNDFDIWVLKQKKSPPFWYGLKFFNVYGPNEYHKSRMASVIFHAYNQLKTTGSVKLFKSHKNEYKDGEQLRDFIYVKDVVSVISWLMLSKPFSGIYNLGTGNAGTFYTLAESVATAMDIPLKIEWIDIPEDIRETYQYFTEAKMDKLIFAGYTKPFLSLQTGTFDYVKNYLMEGAYF